MIANEFTFFHEFAKYGFSGLIIAVLGIYIWSTDKDRRKERSKIYKEHKEERDEWRAQSTCQFREIIDITNKHTEIIGELKVILKSIEKDVSQ